MFYICFTGLIVQHDYFLNKKKPNLYSVIRHMRLIGLKMTFKERST
jgi:hypothetical protein